MDLPKGKDRFSTIHKTIRISPSHHKQPQHDKGRRDINDAATGNDDDSGGTTDIRNRKGNAKGTTRGNESGAGAVKAGPRGHDDMGSHASLPRVSLNRQEFVSRPLKI